MKRTPHPKADPSLLAMLPLPPVAVYVTLNSLTLLSGGTVDARRLQRPHPRRKGPVGGDLELLHHGKGRRVRMMSVAMHASV